MAVQNSTDYTNLPFIRGGISRSQSGLTLAQDTGRSGALAPFTILAKNRIDTSVTVTADAGNTGDGTAAVVLSGVGSPFVGDYNLECTIATADGGTFKIEDPNGNLIANGLEMVAGAGVATIFVAGGLKITITDGATDFIVGDTFNLAVAAGDGYLVPYDPDGIGGADIIAGLYMGASITAASIVAGDIADVQILIGSAVDVDEDQIVCDTEAFTGLALTTITKSGRTVKEELQLLGIWPETTQSIDA